MGINWEIVGPLVLLILFVGAGLAVFGRWYSGVVTALAKEVEGIQSLTVAAGTLMTLVVAYLPIAWVLYNSAAMPAWVTALLVELVLLFCFAASGLPMMSGSIGKHIRLLRQKNAKEMSDVAHQVTRHE